jgi:hypothetical protein
MQLMVEETKQTAASTDFLLLNSTDHVEFWTGNAKQAAYFYRAAFGMELIAYRGPETGTASTISRSLSTTPRPPGTKP